MVPRFLPRLMISRPILESARMVNQLFHSLKMKRFLPLMLIGEVFLLNVEIMKLKVNISITLDMLMTVFTL